MAKRTQLYDAECGVGATFGEWFGWQLPARFADPSLEYHAVRADIGLIDLSYRGILDLRGKDSTRFLNGTVTSDIKSLKAGSGQYAAMLNIHGKLIADMRIYKVADGFWLDLHQELTPKVLQAINRHLIADQVEVRDRSADFLLLALQGPASVELLAQLGIRGVKDLEEYQHLETTIEGIPVWVIRASETGEEGFVLVTEAGAAVAVWKALLQAGYHDRLRPVGMEALNTLRVEAAVPWYGIDMDENDLLQEVGLEGRAASFSKGCYVGQETVVRIAHRGRVNRHLVGLVVGGGDVPEAGATLRYQGREVGRITSAVHSPALNRPIAMGYVRRERIAPGTILELKVSQGDTTAEIVPLPFYKRK
ncbi:MAG: aminomethyl transferase family protein [Candidatus Methylomirabilis oxyfera]|nr:aminomethyl transferase family protein [Candidatus Methylomirabilis oxyfera]